MNYRHAFHAGNFADVVKHAALALILRYLGNKDAPWRFIDTHAGCGGYSLDSDPAARTQEWQNGIARLAPLFQLIVPGIEASALAASQDVREALAPYAEALRAANPDGVLRLYPGSPLIARHLARRQDRLTLTELHPEDAARLAALFAGDIQVKVRRLDGWLALGAFVPPKERRGLVLADPPFEAPGELDRMVEGLLKAHRRWPTGCYMLWHAIKNRAPVWAYERRLEETGIAKMLLAELFIRRPTDARFDGCGLVFVNPPYTLEASLKTLLPFLVGALAQGPGAGYRLDWIRGEG